MGGIRPPEQGTDRSHKYSRASTHCRARLCRIFVSLRLLLSVSRRFRMTISGNRQGIRQSCNHLSIFTHYTMSSTSLDLQLPANMTEYKASGLIVGCFIDSRSSASKLWVSLLDNNNKARHDINDLLRHGRHEGISPALSLKQLSAPCRAVACCY
jgi:hypothetical protein